MESSVTNSTTTIAVPVRNRQVTNNSNVNIPIGYKRCAHCGEIKPLSEFNKDKTRKDGHNSWCRCCTKEAQRNLYIKKREDVKADKAKKLEAAMLETDQKDRIDDSMEPPKLPFNYANKVKRMQRLAFAPDTKECHHCHKIKPMTEFSCDKSSKDGFSNKCKQCTSDYRKKASKSKSKTMKRQTAIIQNNTQTFEYLAIGTKLYYIHGDVAMEAPIRTINIDITFSGALISYIVPSNNPNEEHKIFANEIGSTVFTNPLDLITYFFKKQDMKYNIIKK